MVLDCANGATHRAAPAIFERLGAEVETIGAEPDGRNINEACGSTHPEALAERVEACGASIGFAFDGDGDRVVAVDSDGTVRDGDELIALAALDLAERGALDGGVAVTVMSNYGFHEAMAEAGIEVATTKVGDRNVSAELARRDWSLGGEQSGHLIWTEYAPTGDGIAAALLDPAGARVDRARPTRPMRRLPQVLENVEVAERESRRRAPRRSGRRSSARPPGSRAGGGSCVRPSGTEPLVRVMVEAPTGRGRAGRCAPRRDRRRRSSPESARAALPFIASHVRNRRIRRPAPLP